MPMIVGTVANVRQKVVTNKVTKKQYTLFIYEVDDTIINGGFNQKYNVGDSFNEECTMSKFNELTMPKHTPQGKFVNTSKYDSVPTTSSGPPARSFPVNKLSPEMAIIRQSALKAAVDVYGSMIPPDADDGEEIDVDAHAEKIIQLAYKFADFSSGQREVKITTGE